MTHRWDCFEVTRTPRDVILIGINGKSNGIPMSADELDISPPTPANLSGLSNGDISACRRASWWLAAGALTLVIALLAAMLPARARLIGLFGPIEGIVVGAFLLETSRRWNHARWRCGLGVALLCGCIAFGVSSLLWWREFAQSVREEYRIPSPQLLALQIESQASQRGHTHGLDTLSELQSLQQRFEADPQRTQELQTRCSLSGYLVFRLYGVANAARIRHLQSVATAVWLAEFVATGIACMFIVRRRNDWPAPVETPVA